MNNTAKYMKSLVERKITNDKKKESLKHKCFIEKMNSTYLSRANKDIEKLVPIIEKRARMGKVTFKVAIPFLPSDTNDDKKTYPGYLSHKLNELGYKTKVHVEFCEELNMLHDTLEIRWD